MEVAYDWKHGKYETSNLFFTIHPAEEEEKVEIVTVLWFVAFVRYADDKGYICSPVGLGIRTTGDFMSIRLELALFSGGSTTGGVYGGGAGRKRIRTLWHRIHRSRSVLGCGRFWKGSAERGGERNARSRRRRPWGIERASEERGNQEKYYPNKQQECFCWSFCGAFKNSSHGNVGRKKPHPPVVHWRSISMNQLEPPDKEEEEELLVV